MNRADNETGPSVRESRTAGAPTAMSKGLDPPIDPGSIKRLVEHHKSEPEVSIAAHIRRRIIALGESISSKKKLYLDSRYWIFLRDAALGRPKHPSHAELLERLRGAVRSGVALCPIADVAFIELMKHADPPTRLATARLMDELSQGAALATEQERVNEELAHFMMTAGARPELHPLAHLAWVPPCYALGITCPDAASLDPSDNLVLQKALADACWQMPLEYFVEASQDTESPPIPFEAMAAKLNAEARKHAHQIRSFDQAVMAEISGSLSVYKEHLASVFERMENRRCVVPAPRTEGERAARAQQLHSMLANAFRYARQKMAVRVPTLYVHAVCHASIRWDKKRTLDGHDLLDFHHAAAALGYCEAFFTEKPLRALLISGHVALDRLYGRLIVSEEQDAIRYVRGLLSPPKSD